MDLVTLDEARHHLRIDDFDSSGGPDDEWLLLFIGSVSDAIRTWLKDEWRLYVIEVDSSGAQVVDGGGNPVPALDSSGNPTPRPAVKAAAKLELAVHCRFRDGETGAPVPSHEGHGYILSRGATAMLAGLRKTTVR